MLPDGITCRITCHGGGLTLWRQDTNKLGVMSQCSPLQSVLDPDMFGRSSGIISPKPRAFIARAEHTAKPSKAWAASP
jgi:hypothetical protein